jgi:phage replication O-like protein O
MESNPQLEDGYIRIATEIWEALTAYRIPGEQMQVLFHIIRKTYGWGKKEDGIALSQFIQATGLKKQHVHRALKALKDKNIIVTKKGDYQYITYSFNKRYKKWKQSPKKVTVPKNGYKGYPKKVTQRYPKMVTTIDTSTKDTITKDKLHRSQKNGNNKKAKAVIRYFNKMKKSKYQDFTQILARLNEGRTIRECVTVINNKFSDEYFQENPRFLNPTTLFRKSHWDKYINDIPPATHPLKGVVSDVTIKNIKTLEEWDAK